MPEIEQRNIEIKVRLSAAEYRTAQESAAAFVAQPGNRSTDVDTYFRVPRGRLKLRVSDEEPVGTLISYERPDQASSRVSIYRLVSIPNASGLRETLSVALGILVTVTKRRHVVMYGETRIHFDDVEELGYFIELETVIGTQSYDSALAEHRYVFDRLGLAAREIVPQSYSDLLLQRDQSA